MSIKKTVAILAAAGALSAVALPALADTSLYGVAKISTFYNVSMIPDNGAVSGGTSAGVDEHLMVTSNFGANYTNGNVGGKFEIGANMGLRLLYGTYNFGSGTLIIGQDYNSYYFRSAQTAFDDAGQNGYGALWDGRQAQIKVKFTNGFYAAAIAPSVADTVTIASNAPTYGTNATGTAIGDAGGVIVNHEKADSIQVYLPKVNVGYAGKAGILSYNIGVVGQTFKYVPSTANKSSNSTVTSVMGYTSATADLGATKLSYNLSIAQNAGNMGLMGRQSAKILANGNAQDSIGFEGFGQISQKISDTATFNAGFGYATDKTPGDTYSDDKMLFFVNAPITLAKNVTVTPEFDYVDDLKASDGTTQSKGYLVGAKWQIAF